MTYIPEQGDIVWISLNPQSGHEQKGRRQALTVSNRAFNTNTGLAIFCPITNTDNGFPLHVKLEDSKTTGFVMAEHIKSLDYNAREAEFIEKASDETIIEIMSIINACL